ncbi:MAG: pyridoxal-phosphate dependent enzyme, partial [Alcaligenaceae bacterium]
MIDLSVITQARANMHGQVLKTPFSHSRTLSDILGADIWLKFENLQFTASFKERGAFNRMNNPSDLEDYSWGKYDQGDHDVDGDSLYLVTVTSGSTTEAYKVWIQRYDSYPADSIHWEFEGSAKIRQIAKTYTSAHITLSGANVHIEKGEFDGNQNAMVAGQGSGGLLVTGATPTLIGVKCHGYNGTGYTNQSSNIGTRRGLHIGCSFDDNAGLGVLTSGASYLDFISCTFDRNGYGFQRFRVTY